MANPDNTSTTPLATVSTASGPERADQSFLEWANSLGDPLRAGAIDSASIRRATALLMALADRDAAAAIEVLDEFIANVGIDQVEFEAAVRSYEQDYALDGSQRLIPVRWRRDTRVPCAAAGHPRAAPGRRRRGRGLRRLSECPFRFLSPTTSWLPIGRPRSPITSRHCCPTAHRNLWPTCR